MRNIFRKTFRRMIWIMNCITPKNSNRILMRSAFKYPDNTQALLDVLLSRENTYTIFCVGDGFEAYNDSRVKKYSLNSFKAILAYCTCRYVFYDSAIFLEAPPVKKQISVNLWHGISLKKIGYYVREDTKQYRTATYGVTYSPLFAEKMSHAFAIPIENVLCTGEPRNDYLFNPAPDSILKRLGIPIGEGNRYVIWMPTYRQSIFNNDVDGAEYEYGFPIINSGNIRELHDFCKEHNIILIMKWHGLQKIPSMGNDTWSNFCFLTTEMITTLHIPFYRVVACCDALVTDYSSIYVNFMVLNRPICFAYDDMDKYTEKRGFMFDDVVSIMPGKHVHTLDGLLSFLQNIDNDEYKRSRTEMCSVLNSHNDSHNSERLIHFFDL